VVWLFPYIPHFRHKNRFIITKLTLLQKWIFITKPKLTVKKELAHFNAIMHCYSLVSYLLNNWIKYFLLKSISIKKMRDKIIFENFWNILKIYNNPPHISKVSNKRLKGVFLGKHRRYNASERCSKLWNPS
jgi:hypothetical protein